MNKYEVHLHKKGQESLPYIIHVIANDEQEAATKAKLTIADNGYWPLCYNNMYDKLEALVVDNVLKTKQIDKRVVQISLDIVVGNECDGFELAESVADELNMRGYTVLGAGFQEDLTELYEEQYPELLNTNELS